MKITKTMKDNIIDKESSKKFGKVSKDIDIAMKKKLKELAILVSPVVSDELMPYIKVTSSVYYKSNTYRIGITLPLKIGDWSIKIPSNSELDKIMETRKLIATESINFREDLRQVLSSYNTDKKLLLDVPELARYFVGVSTGALVPVNLIKSVRKSLVVEGEL